MSVKSAGFVSAASWLALLASVVYVAVLLTDYNAVWSQPEYLSKREILLAKDFDHPVSWLKEAFNWQLMEDGAPRLTRLASSFADLADTRLRFWYYQHFLPHPSLSVAWLFTLGLTPLFLYCALKRWQFSSACARFGVALYFSLPATLSLVVMGFRPGKAMAMSFGAGIVYLLARLDKARHEDATVGRLALSIAAVYFLSLFTDEIAVFGLAFIIVLQDYRQHARSAFVLAASALAATAGYFLFAGYVLPTVHEWAGYPVACTRACYAGEYVLQHDLRSALLLRQDATYYVDLVDTLWRNARLVFRDLSGLGLVRDPTHVALQILSLSCLVLLAFAVTLGATWTFAAGQYLLLLSLALLFHAALMMLTPHRIWSVYWYGVFTAIPFILCFSLILDGLMDRSAASRILCVPLICAIIMANFINFRSTNYAYKDYHFYPLRAEHLSAMFRSDEKFFLTQERYSRFDLQATTRRFMDIRRRGAMELPAELEYLTVETQICPYLVSHHGEMVSVRCRAAPDGARLP